MSPFLYKGGRGKREKEMICNYGGNGRVKTGRGLFASECTVVINDHKMDAINKPGIAVADVAAGPEKSSDDQIVDGPSVSIAFSPPALSRRLPPTCSNGPGSMTEPATVLALADLACRRCFTMNPIRLYSLRSWVGQCFCLAILIKENRGRNRQTRT